MFKNDYLEISNEDNMELMARYPDNYFELAVVDPPYGINVNMNMGRRKGKRKVHKEKAWDSEIPNTLYFEELFRVSKNQIIWGGNYFPLGLTKSWIFWDKQVPDGVSFADGELAWTSFDMTLRKAKIKYTGFQGMDNGGKIHPTQKPVALYEWIFKNYAKQGDKILDTHLGSGSIAIALHNMNERDGMNLSFTACELDKDYYNASIKRIEQHIAQKTIFSI